MEDLMQMLTDTKTVGVIVARFQLPDLHAGHRHLIGYVCERHKDVVIILGVARGMLTNLNPLPFEMRAQMVRSAFPERRLTILPLRSRRDSYAERSEHIDTLIAKEFPGRPVVIYGSRDSVVQKYAGSFPTVEVPTIFDILPSTSQSFVATQTK
jgi:nicotinamide mononucleotide adenylyltransferase